MKNISVKNDFLDHKLRWDLLPLEEVEDIVKVFTAGANKYGDNNWQHLENGYQRYKGAMLRHLLEYEKGTEFDEETGCRHLAQVAWNAIAMLYHGKHKGMEISSITPNNITYVPYENVIHSSGHQVLDLGKFTTTSASTIESKIDELNKLIDTQISKCNKTLDEIENATFTNNQVDTDIISEFNENDVIKNKERTLG